VWCNVVLIYSVPHHPREFRYLCFVGTCPTWLMSIQLGVLLLRGRLGHKESHGHGVGCVPGHGVAHSGSCSNSCRARGHGSAQKLSIFAAQMISAFSGGAEALFSRVLCIASNNLLGFFFWKDGDV
jgi:hypothetical protein